MKQYLLILLSAIGCVVSLNAQLPMQGWQIHTAYNNVTRVEDAGDKVFALSEGSLFSVDKEEQSITYYNRLTGLTSTDIADIKYDAKRGMLLVVYNNGYIDFLRDDEITNIPDLYNTQLSISKAANHISINQNYAYLAMNFGIVALNLTRQEIADTYYIGANAEAIQVLSTAVLGDTLYAVSKKHIYAASLHDNLIDYSYWQCHPIEWNGEIQQIVSYHNSLGLLCDSVLYLRNNNIWSVPFPEKKFYKLIVSSEKLLALSPEDTYIINKDASVEISPYYVGAADMFYDDKNVTYWYAYFGDGVTSYYPQSSSFNSFLPTGPLTNTAYRMRFAGNRLFIVNGGYAGVPYNREPYLMWMENGQWNGYSPSQLRAMMNYDKIWDWCDIIANENDPAHFYVASYGNGLIEFRDNTFYKWHYSKNSPLNNLITGQDEQYTRVDGLAFDSKGNLWMQDNSTSGIKILAPEGKWTALSNMAGQKHSRMRNLIVDNKNENVKYVFNAYQAAGIGIMDDNGTLDYEGDDKAAHVSGWVDEDGNSVNPTYMWCAAQDHNGALWVGTEAGVLKFPNPYSLFTSNTCTRIKIARTDGSGLADYLLGEEMINAIAVDGANRIWFGTEGSGAYLMDLSDPQNIVTVHHYTTDNSPLLSNNILSIAINPITGEVFFGTGGGLVSYQSDAAEGKYDYSTAYAYPNPVRVDFEGVITIAGLMEDTHVRITDNGGNLVYETKSNGGIAIWDGRNGRGERVSSGVYFAMCVTADGENKTLVKILVMN